MATFQNSTHDFKNRNDAYKVFPSGRKVNFNINKKVYVGTVMGVMQDHNGLNNWSIIIKIGDGLYVPDYPYNTICIPLCNVDISNKFLLFYPV